MSLNVLEEILFVEKSIDDLRVKDFPLSTSTYCCEFSFFSWQHCNFTCYLFICSGLNFDWHLTPMSSMNRWKENWYTRSWYHFHMLWNVSIAVLRFQRLEFVWGAPLLLCFTVYCLSSGTNLNEMVGYDPTLVVFRQNTTENMT